MNCELAAVKNQMATAEENLKIATEEIHKYKQQIEQRREQLQRAELTFRHQIAVYEKTAQHNWIKTQIWERAMAEERREAAHLKHRLDMMEGKRPLEGYMRQKPMPGRPQTQNPPRREPLADPETGVAPVSHNDKHSTKNAEKDKVNAGAIFSCKSVGKPSFAVQQALWPSPCFVCCVICLPVSVFQRHSLNPRVYRLLSLQPIIVFWNGSSQRNLEVEGPMAFLMCSGDNTPGRYTALHTKVSRLVDYYYTASLWDQCCYFPLSGHVINMLKLFVNWKCGKTSLYLYIVCLVQLRMHKVIVITHHLHHLHVFVGK
ncbi:transport and Golgi organization protein 1 homolog isoform X1 [Lynx rufus]|uniref:transport and Golgi organization protein 1 homolog isoform X1 n=1 Tax=Lynx rufus TaxID=61384 RepID=UPI001F12840D|nr:transport and Golgi organization protein 1 homolog isoform X1 [Lynx rufus]